MSTVIIPGKPASDEAAKKSLADAIIDAIGGLDSVLTSLLGAVLPNGSFESFETGATTPLQWESVLLQNGAAAKETSTVFHGATAWKFTRISGAGNGGGTLQQAIFIPTSEGKHTVELFYRASAALKSKVEVLFYDKAQSLLSTGTGTIQEATCQKRYSFDFEAPALARFYKVKLTGGATDVDVAGNCTFDGLRVTHRLYDYADYASAINFTGISITSGSWQTVGTVDLLVPSDCTTFKMTLAVTENGGGGGTIRTRFSIGGTASTESSYAAASTVTEELSCTVPAGSKGTIATVSIQAYEGVNPATGEIKWTSSVSSGREANVKVEP